MAGIKILLVEDDWIIAKEITLSLQDMGFEPVGTIDSGEEAIRQMPVLQPDLVLLDIGLSGDMTGIDTARQLKQQFKVPYIFLTALADQSTLEQAKLTEPYAYLVKPVSPESLYSSIEITMHNASQRKVTDVLPAEPLVKPLQYEEGIFVKNKKRLEKVQLSDVLYIEAVDVYAMMFTVHGKFLLSNSLKSVEEKFPASHFMRVHRSFIVNTHKIEAIEENDLMLAGRAIPIGKTFREPVMSRLQVL